MKTIFGGIIEFKDEKEFSEFFENLKYEDAIKIIESSLLFSIKMGAFDLSEAYAIYNSLEKIKNEKNNNN